MTAASPVRWLLDRAARPIGIINFAGRPIRANLDPEQAGYVPAPRLMRNVEQAPEPRPVRALPPPAVSVPPPPAAASTPRQASLF